MDQLRFAFAPQIVVDLFCGGGGASEGIRQAFGRDPDVCIDHDDDAISMHAANHPGARHYVSDVFGVDPVEATGGKPVGLLWASPDCKHFSRAKGGKPRSKKIRALAWVVVTWAKKVRPRVIIVENVEEFWTWGPLLRCGNPCPRRKGQTFARWIAQLRAAGYAVQWRELRACDYGAPTIRKRLLVVARCDGQPIRWPDPTHGKPGSLEVRNGTRKPWRTAAECIDWSLPVPSIFERTRPLAEATLRRIAAGVMRYVVQAAEPYSISYEQLGAVVSSGQNNTLVAAFLAKHYGGVVGQDLRQPIGTVTSVDHHSLVTVTIAGDPYVITDIGMRMLQPRELFRAQGFPETYQIERGHDGRRFSKSAQVRMCGNSVCPPIAQAIVAANCGQIIDIERRDAIAGTCKAL